MARYFRQRHRRRGVLQAIPNKLQLRAVLPAQAVNVLINIIYFAALAFAAASSSSCATSGCPYSVA